MTDPITVLVADDQTLVREGIARLLDEADDILIVGEAADGRRAVRLAHELQPQVVVLDVRMPRLDGLESARLIHADLPGIGILMLTFYEDIDLFFEAIKAGANGYLLKSADQQTLRRAVRAVAAGDAYLQPSLARRLVDHTRETELEPGPSSGYSLLTVREREVLIGIADGLSNREIAQRLYISPSTVQTHRSHLLAKLSLNSTAELVRFAIRNGLVET
ncbi:MAG: response regulator transcription factor [Dehalococcoidia bacterium]